MKKRLYIGIVVLEIILLFLSVGTYISKKDNLIHQKVSFENMQLNSGYVENNVIYVSSDLEENFVCASVPLPELEKSKYTVNISYNSTTDQSYTQIDSASLADVNFDASKVMLYSWDNNENMHLDLNKDADDLVLNVYIQGTGEVQITDITLTQNSDLYKRNIVVSLFVGIIASLFVYIYFSDVQKRNEIFLVLACVLASSVPLFMNYLVYGHDLSFHLNRIECIAEGIRCGDFPVKIQPLWLNGYGYPVGVFYGDLLLYIAVFFRLFGFSIQTSYQLFIFCVNILTVLIAYYSFNRLFQNNNISLLGTIIYTLSLYRIENIYTRAAVGEYCAMVFLPLILCGMYEILFSKKRMRLIPPELLVVIGLAGVIHSHVISCLLVGFTILVTCVVCIKRVIQPSVFFRLCGVVVLTLLLSLDFLVPFIDYYLQDYVCITSEDWIGKIDYIQDNGLFFNQIFSVFVNPSGYNQHTSLGLVGETTISLGLLGIVAVIIYVLWMINVPQNNKKDEEYKLARYAFVFFVFAVCMSSCYFPWNQIIDMNSFFETLVTSVQFPWRFLIIANLFSAVFLCVVFKQMKENLSEIKRYIAIILIIVSVIISNGQYYGGLMLFSEAGNPICFYTKDDLALNDIYSMEYLPAGTDIQLVQYDKIITTDNVSYTDYWKDGLKVTCNVNVIGENGYIEVPILYYKGYQAVDLNTGKLLDSVCGDNNVVRVLLPNDYSGNIEISFKEPFYWRVSEFISLVCLGGTMIYIIIRKKRGNTYEFNVFKYKK